MYTLKINSLDTNRLLEHVKEHHSVFMFASCSEIYGDAETIPTPESSWGRVNPAGVRSSYFYPNKRKKDPGTDWSTSSNVTSRTASVVVVFPPVAIGLTEADNFCTNLLLRSPQMTIRIFIS